MGKKALTAVILLAVLFAAYFFGSGLIKCTSAYVEDYSVSEDGGTLTLRMGVASSAGYIGRARVHQQQGGKLYLDFYSAFGGVNGRLRARDTFRFELDEDTAMVGICCGRGCYREVLRLEDGSWHRVKD